MLSSRSVFENRDEPLRDIHISFNLPTRGEIAAKKISARNRQNVEKYTEMLTGQIRSFSIINTVSQYADPHKIEAELYYVSDLLAVWTTKDAIIDEAALRTCIKAAENVIIPRITLLWGTPVDIDNDGRIAVLVSPSINNEKTAVGFFNPADFFKWNNDVSSENYNPASNEMDIIYIAVPESSANSSYSTETIIATIAHELTHTVTFSVKTWQRITEGDTTARQEELFLSEGWSHLTENLCGYGMSGGNIRFLQRYFEDTAAYSLCGPNRLGQDDSPGMRGGITLFLSWMFWKKGGIIWDEHDPLLFTDNGGIAFLRKMMESSITGWNCIGESYGTPTQELFEQMVSEINVQRIANTSHESISDPLTGEPVEFFSNMIFSVEENTVRTGFPKTYDQQEYFREKIVPWSFQLFHPVNFSEIEKTDTSEISISADEYDGAVYYNLGL